MLKLTPDKVLSVIAEKPGLMAKDISSILGVKRKDVNSILYGDLSAKVQKDGEYCWFLIDKNAILEPKDAIESQNFSAKPIKIQPSEFPGNSLFLIRPTGSEITVETNYSHLFFANIYSNLDEGGKTAVDQLVSSIALVCEKHYTEIDFIEEFVDELGAALKKLAANN